MNALPVIIYRSDKLFKMVQYVAYPVYRYSITIYIHFLFNQP